MASDVAKCHVSAADVMPDRLLNVVPGMLESEEDGESVETGQGAQAQQADTPEDGTPGDITEGDGTEGAVVAVASGSVAVQDVAPGSVAQQDVAPGSVASQDVAAGSLAGQDVGDDNGKRGTNKERHTRSSWKAMQSEQ